MNFQNGTRAMPAVRNAAARSPMTCRAVTTVFNACRRYAALSHCSRADDRCNACSGLHQCSRPPTRYAGWPMLGVWIEQRLHRDRRNGGAAAVHVAEERSQAEAALAFAAAIVESSDDAIVGMTLYGMITSWNAGAERLYGYTAREVFGRWPVGITIPEDELPKIPKRVGRGQRVN